MGLYSSFYASLSGLSGNSTALSVIGNNLANMNTIGFKGSSTTFQDLFAAALGPSGTQGNGNPSQIGLGSRLGSVFQNFAQGSFASTSSVTDMAIQGQGFFQVDLKGGGAAYTRAGNFTLDKFGNLVDAAGNYVKGWNRNSLGVVDTSTPANRINIPVGSTIAATPSSNFGFVTNLDSTSPVGAAFTSSIQVYDSQGATHNMVVTYTKTAANAWNYAIWSPDALVGGNPSTLANPITTGNLTFNANGTLLAPAANPAAFAVTWNNGAAASSLSWNIFSGTPAASNLGQYASASTTSNSFQNGFGSGNIRSLTVDQNGLISGSFTNGQTIPLSQMALATFANSNGMQKVGDNAWLETLASGPASVGLANQGGRGSILGSNLELSNVDVAEEFTRLIVSQRGYQASSKVLTTSDQLLQETLNLRQ